MTGINFTTNQSPICLSVEQTPQIIRILPHGRQPYNIGKKNKNDIYYCLNCALHSMPRDGGFKTRGFGAYIQAVVRRGYGLRQPNSPYIHCAFRLHTFFSLQTAPRRIAPSARSSGLAAVALSNISVHAGILSPYDLPTSVVSLHVHHAKHSANGIHTYTF